MKIATRDWKKRWRIMRWRTKRMWLALQRALTTKKIGSGEVPNQHTDQTRVTRELSLFDLAMIVHNMHAAATYERDQISRRQDLSPEERQRLIDASDARIRGEVSLIYQTAPTSPRFLRLFTAIAAVIGMCVVASIVFGSDVIIRTKTSDAAVVSHAPRQTMSIEKSATRIPQQPAAVPVHVATPPASAVMIYRVRAAKNQSVGEANTEFGCKPGALATYNKFTAKSIFAGSTFWVPGDECSYNGKGAPKHVEAILTYTVPPGGTTKLAELGTSFGCENQSMRNYYQRTNPKGDANNLRVGEVVYLPGTMCKKLP